MAKEPAQKKSADEIVLPATAKVKRLVIRNFRCIGADPVSIDLDNIVVLVGPNNVGKSTILRAYEVVMNHAELTQQDFPQEDCDPQHCTAGGCPEIELQTFVDKSSGVGDEWLLTGPGSDATYVRELWTWEQPAAKPKRQGFSNLDQAWSDRVPWGAPNVAKSHRPLPHRVDAFANPETQATEIVTLLTKALTEKVKGTRPEDRPDAESLLQTLHTLQEAFATEARDEIAAIETGITELIQSVFKGYAVSFDPGLDSDPDLTSILFKGDRRLRMGPKDGHLAPIAYQGSGARRTLLWAAMKFLSEHRSAKQPDRPHVLLMDEPEMCLHPNAIREARKTLYDLAEADGSGWQVMITTHSPLFIDLTRDNTTIVRVDRTKDDKIQGTTVFRPDLVKLTSDDREELKLLNACDPHVAEFFFGGNIVVVEGDTEYSAFCRIVAESPGEFADLHIIRARGKATIVALLKILNHFAASYSVLHDTDTPKTSDGTSSGAWTTNQSILTAVKAAPEGADVRLVASLINFDRAFLSHEPKSDKPYAAVRRLGEDKVAYAAVRSLLAGLIDHSQSLPDGAIEWHGIDDIAEPVQRVLSTVKARIV